MIVSYQIELLKFSDIWNYGCLWRTSVLEFFERHLHVNVKFPEFFFKISISMNHKPPE